MGVETGLWCSKRVCELEMGLWGLKCACGGRVRVETDVWGCVEVKTDMWGL